jgi:hypothetical protein
MPKGVLTMTEMPASNTFHIKFPGNIILEVHLQDPHPVHLTVRFPDNVGGVDFTYSPGLAPSLRGVAEPFGEVALEKGTDYPTRVRPSSPALATTAHVLAMNQIGIEFNEPGGSRM